MKKMLTVIFAFTIAFGFVPTVEYIGILTASAADVNEEAQEVYQSFRDSISFIATDSTWADFLTMATFNEATYNLIFPDSTQKTPYADLTAFDKIVYAVTYVEMASYRKDIEYWNSNVINSRDNFDNMCTSRYVLGVNARGGNSKETVLAALQTLWDWQYQYCLDNGEPYNFIYNCSYADTGFVGQNPTTPTQEPQEPTQGITEDEKIEIPGNVPNATQPPEKEPGLWDGVIDILSNSLLTIGILAVAVIALIVVLIRKRKLNVD